MIIDTVGSVTRYAVLHPDSTEAFHLLQTLDFANLPGGQTSCEDSNIRIFIDSEPTKTQGEAKPEVHLKHIGIQAPIDGSETYGWIDKGRLKNGLGYSEKRDIEFLDCEPGTRLTLEPGEFALFFSNDAHAPLVDDRANIREVVFKTRVEAECL